MKTDLYTKTVLTVIAIALTCIVFQNYDLVPSVNASVSTVPTVTQTGQGVVDVRIVDYKYGMELPVDIRSSIDIPVEVDSYSTLPVEIKSSTTIPVKVDSYSTLPVSIENVRTTVPVKVENTVSVSNR